MEAIIKEIKEHIATLNDEMGDIQVLVAVIQVDVSWLKKVSFWQLALLGSLLISAIAALLW